MTMIAMFPTTIGEFDLKVDNNKILDKLKKIKYKDTYVNNKEASALISDEYNVLKYFPSLKKQILKKVYEYSNEHKYMNEKYKIQCSWSTKTKPKAFSQFHSHSHSFFSGVYYPVAKRGFNISFQKPYDDTVFWDKYVQSYNYFNCSQFTLPVRDNLLLIFHSYLKHRIESNEAFEDRYSIAFNITPKGLIGYDDKLKNLS